MNRHKRVSRVTPKGDFINNNPSSIDQIEDYTNSTFDHYSLNFNSLGYKPVTVQNVNISSSHDSAQYAFEQEKALPPRRKGKIHADVTFKNQLAWEHYEDGHPRAGIFVFQDSTPGYVGRANWVYGDAIRIYTDGTGAGVRFLDSDVFRGGATEAQMIEDSTWSDFGGIIAATTDSHPDNAFTNATWDSSPDWSTHSYLLTNAGSQNYFGNSNYVDFQIAQNIVPFEYDSSDILYTQDALDSASAAGGGGGGGGGAAADPESWS